MKKLIVLAVVSIFAIHQLKAQINFGIKGGFSGVNQSFKGSDAEADEEVKELNDNKKMLPAFHVGVTADIPPIRKFNYTTYTAICQKRCKDSF